MVSGQCLCGAIHYQVELIPNQVYNCHCSMCQRSHGAAFATQVLANGNTLTFLKGEEQLSDYFSGGGYRAFCSTCGSRLMNYAEDKGQYLSVAIGCLETKEGIEPVANVCTETRLGWCQLSDKIPAYEGIPQDILD